MLPFCTDGVIRLDVPLRPEELLAAWRLDSRRLALPAREPLGVQQRVAARISVVGLGIAATITGRVASVRRDRGLQHIELAPDDARIRAVERLLAAARGEPVGRQTRAPRFLATIPAVIQGGAGSTYMTTYSVSENGCGLTWSGTAPAVGVAMDVRLGAGSRVASLRGVVCWTDQPGRTVTVGVRFVAGARSAWARMLTDLKGSGAPLA